MTNSAAERIMGLLRWLVIFVYLQFSLVVGSLAGLVIGGFFPSLYASILVAKELMKNKTDYTATRRYIKIYKTIFWKANQIGYLGTFAALIGVSNIIFFNQLQSTVSAAFFIKLVWLVVTFLVLTTLSLITPTFIDYQLKLKELPKLFLIGLGDFRSLLEILLGLVVLYAGFLFFTGIFFFIVLGIYIMLIAATNASFERRKIVFQKDKID